MIKTPYLLFLGDAPDPLAAKVAQGIRDWRPDNAVGQFRMEGCKADMKLPDMTLAEAKAAGAQTLVRSAEKWGLVAYEGVGATSIQVTGDRVRGVQTDQGFVHTGLVVNAAGPWGGHIGKSAGCHYSIRWSREADLVLKLPPNFGPLPIVGDPGCHIYFRPHNDNRILVGLDYPKEIEPLNIENYDASLDENTRSRIENGLFRRIPQLRDTEFDRGWASIYTITDDWHPVVGAEPELEGYYACFGGSGHGSKLGPPIGEALSDIIAGKKPDIDIHALRPNRFIDGEIFTSAWGGGNRA